MEKIAVVGLGYVGLPVALAFARKFAGTVGFDVYEEWGLRLAALEEIRDVDALILAVSHCAYRDLGTADLLGRVRAGGVVFDMKSMLDPREIPAGVRYLSL